MNTISKKANTITKEKGMTAFDNVSTDIPEIPEPTNKFPPHRRRNETYSQINNHQNTKMYRIIA